MMAMNPRNILSLLRQSFDEPQYDIESVITVKERSFARQLEDLIKDTRLPYKPTYSLRVIALFAFMMTKKIKMHF